VSWAFVRWLTRRRTAAPSGLQSSTPNASALPPARLGRAVPELLAADLALESEAVQLYADALAHAQRQRDGECAQLFAGLLADETRHAQELALFGGKER